MAVRWWVSGSFASTRIVVAENYPRAVYAAALSEYPSHQRCLTAVAKTKPEIRKYALDRLASLSWIGKYGIGLQDMSVALADENAFDALLTAAGLLRVLLEQEQLFSPEFVDPVAEGGILGTGTINFDRAPQIFSGVAAPIAKIPSVSMQPVYACPISKCPKRFIGSRGGWDGHVSSLRNHPNWHARVTSRKDRVKLFRVEFPLFFTQIQRGESVSEL